jgi:hypothetical protein
MAKKSYAVLYGDHGGELDREEIIRDPRPAIRALVDRCTFAPGDVIKIEMTETDR